MAFFKNILVCEVQIIGTVRKEQLEIHEMEIYIIEHDPL